MTSFSPLQRCTSIGCVSLSWIPIFNSRVTVFGPLFELTDGMIVRLVRSPCDALPTIVRCERTLQIVITFMCGVMTIVVLAQFVLKFEHFFGIKSPDAQEASGGTVLPVDVSKLEEGLNGGRGSNSGGGGDDGDGDGANGGAGAHDYATSAVAVAHAAVPSSASASSPPHPPRCHQPEGGHWQRRIAGRKS